MNTPTPHNNAKVGEIAKTVILPGDPLRAKLIAEKFLTEVKQISNVRNNLCYTGNYNGKQVSVMSSGMGCASMGIYSYELFNFYNVENAIRVGTIGAINKNYHIGDIIIAENCITDTNYLNFYAENGESKIECSSGLLEKAIKISKQNNILARSASIYTTDTFYGSKRTVTKQTNSGAVGVEMECAALYLNAKKSNSNALTICTVSDEIYSGKLTTSEERQNMFMTMCKLALDLAYSLW